jgi:hypothetical protein
MRLWSLHPDYLDPLGLSRCYFEGVGGLKALKGIQKMHKNHPQLQRFKKQTNPEESLKTYLKIVFKTAKTRGKDWDSSLIGVNIIEPFNSLKMPVKKGQIKYEINWLLEKIKNRKKVHKEFVDKILNDKDNIKLHPLFYQIDGEIEEWERVKI